MITEEGRSFSIHTIRPFAHSCLGSRSPNEYMLIVLTGDSFIPKGNLSFTYLYFHISGDTFLTFFCLVLEVNVQ